MYKKLRPLLLGIVTVTVYHSLISLLRVLLYGLSAWKVTGAEYIPTSGGCVFVANHVHILDPPLVAASSRQRRLRTMAKREIFRIPLIGWVFKAYGAIEVRRQGADFKALRTSMRLLQEGQAVLLFAEGTRSRGGPLRKAQRGAGLIALRSGLPVIPVSIIGSNISIPRVFVQWIFRNRPRIEVHFGHPVDLGGLDPDGEGAAEATERIMRRIAALLPEDLRGPYADTQYPSGQVERDVLS